MFVSVFRKKLTLLFNRQTVILTTLIDEVETALGTRLTITIETITVAEDPTTTIIVVGFRFIYSNCFDEWQTNVV